MIFNGIAVVIGLLILGMGIYYLIKEKKDPEGRKIYMAASVAGAVIVVGALIKIFMELP